MDEAIVTEKAIHGAMAVLVLGITSTGAETGDDVWICSRRLR